jgi:hypothetical protein
MTAGRPCETVKWARVGRGACKRRGPPAAPRPARSGTFRNVSFWPAKEASAASSSTADERTASGAWPWSASHAASRAACTAAGSAAPRSLSCAWRAACVASCDARSTSVRPMAVPAATNASVVSVTQSATGRPNPSGGAGRRPCLPATDEPAGSAGSIGRYRNVVTQLRHEPAQDRESVEPEDEESRRPVQQPRGRPVQGKRHGRDSESRSQTDEPAPGPRPRRSRGAEKHGQPGLGGREGPGAPGAQARGVAVDARALPGEVEALPRNS